LNLGYQSDIENTKAKIKTILKNVKYFNSQDIIGQIGQNGTIIIKSYIPSNNTSEMYLANSKICEEIQQKLSSINSLDFHIASGDAYNNLIDISKSYKEAKEIMEIGRKYNKDERYFSLKSIILEDTYHYLDTHIKNKLIITTLDKLKEVEQETYKQLLSVTESFIDCNFNISKTSQLTQLHRNTINNKLIKFKAITGLDPLNNFSEAFLIKMIAIYDKYNN
jgi:sugar diacid utilization regulator